MNIEILDKIEHENETHYIIVRNGKKRLLAKRFYRGEIVYEEILYGGSIARSDEINEIFEAIEKWEN